MSVSLDDIWDVPVEITPSSPTKRASGVRVEDLPGPSPSKRARTSLFLPDSEDENDGKPTKSRSNPVRKLNPELEALFDDIDPGLEDELPELAPSLDLDALRREATARHVAKQPAHSSHETSSSTFPEKSLDTAEDEERNKDQGDGGGKSKRKTLPKLDEARLLGPDGFPVLVKQTKSFKPKGKGHEVSDLNRLLQIYQFWAHKLYPRNQFRENVQRIEKLCHSKRMQVAMSVWRDESKGLVNGRKRPDNDVDMSEEEQDGDEARASALPDISQPGSDPHTGPDVNSSSPRPPSSGSELSSDRGDDFDIDAVIREDQERQESTAMSRSKARSPSLNPETGNYRSKPPSSGGGDDDEALWATLEDPILAESSLDSGFTTDSMQGGGRVSRQSDEEDEEMWQIVRDMEQEEATKSTTHLNGGPPGGTMDGSEREPNLVEEVPETRIATNDEGWDEMYL